MQSNRDQLGCRRRAWAQVQGRRAGVVRAVLDHGALGLRKKTTTHDGDRPEQRGETEKGPEMAVVLTLAQIGDGEEAGRRRCQAPALSQRRGRRGGGGRVEAGGGGGRVDAGGGGRGRVDAGGGGRVEAGGGGGQPDGVSASVPARACALAK